MGMDLYALFRVKGQRLPSRITEQLEQNDTGESFRVKNITHPALLVWTGVNSGDILDPQVGQHLGNTVPAELSTLCDTRVLLFSDGGEPRTSWRRRCTYDTLVAEIAGSDTDPDNPFYRWIEMTPQDWPEQVSSLDGFLSSLDPLTIFRVLNARKTKDGPQIRKILRQTMGKNYPEPKVEAWIKSLKEKP